MLKMRVTGFAVGLVAVLGWVHPSEAGIITNQSFDTDPVLSDTVAPGVWWTDRFAPAEFKSQDFMGDNRLLLGIDGDDQQDNGFRNTQGRGFNTPGADRLSIDMFIDESFANVEGRIGGFWGVGLDASGDRSLFPIIEFFDGQFQVFDSLDDENGFGFIEVGTPSEFDGDFGKFFNLKIILRNGVTDFLINDQQALTLTAGDTTELGSVILQGVNQGEDRRLFFDNLQAVPSPATLALFGMGLVGLGVAARRRRR